VNAYILVGGRSLRMGSSKAELFLDRVVAAASPVFDEVLAVNRHDAEPLRTRTIFEDVHEGEGALFGIARALADARGRCFIIAVDYPLVTSELLQFLAMQFEESAAAALVPEWDGMPQPLCAGWDAELALPIVERRIAMGDCELRSLIAELGAVMIPEADLRARFSGEPLMNVNTPEELAAAERWYG
jgi:molybdopterin-guanine dinucleotide biosynthesis protein A